MDDHSEENDRNNSRLYLLVDDPCDKILTRHDSRYDVNLVEIRWVTIAVTLNYNHTRTWLWLQFGTRR